LKIKDKSIKIKDWGLEFGVWHLEILAACIGFASEEKKDEI